jgi:hypothetical protein
VSDDWRLRIDLPDDGAARRLGDLLGDRDLEHDLGTSFGERAVVSVDGHEVFCYTGTRRQAQAAESVIRRLAADNGWRPQIELRRWHPTAERWEDPEEPLPADPQDSQAEREQRLDDERAASAQQGYPEMEVRVSCGSRLAAAEISRRLDEEGIPHLHRWSYLLIGATDEDSAQALAEQLRQGVAADATVSVELNPRAVYDARPASPFAVLGGMGG